MKPSIEVDIDTAKAQLHSEGTVVHAQVTVTVHKAEARLGDALISLICEERARDAVKTSEIASVRISEIPGRLPRGSHSYPIELQIPSTAAKYPSSLIVEEGRKRRVGIFWVLRLTFSDSSSAMGAVGVQVYPSRVLNLDDRAIQAALNPNAEDEEAEEEEETGGAPAYRRSPGGFLMQGEQASDACRSKHYRAVKSRSSVIFSKNNDEPARTQNRLLLLLFGETIKQPDKGELGEIQVRATLYIPRWGVFQSPHKLGMRLFVETGRDNSVVLAAIKVKLIAKTRLKGTQEEIVKIQDICDDEINAVLPKGESDFTSEISNLEIPTTSESTETDYLLHHHAVRVTLVFRALHLFNMSRWSTIEGHVTVLPSIFRLPAASEPIPPPYEGAIS